MEHHNRDDIIAPFGFLEEEDVQRHFADLNIALLSGRHILEKNDFYLFRILDKYFDNIAGYYQSLYNFILTQKRYENETCYYLSFSEEGKGKLSETFRYKELSPAVTIGGLTILNMYYERYFERKKVVSWSDLEKAILEEKNSNLYKKIWFNDIRDYYEEKEWSAFYTKIRKVLIEFKKLGWISGDIPKSNSSVEERENLQFEINVSINRFAELYEEEITNFDEFTERILQESNK